MLLSKNLKIEIYSTIIWPRYFYECETWSLLLQEGRKLWVFGNMVLRKLFGPMSDKVKGEWRRFYYEELNEIYCSQNIVRVIKWRRYDFGWACGSNG